MSVLALPGETVQFYNDGPDWPTTPLLQEAERALLYHNCSISQNLPTFERNYQNRDGLN